MSNSRNYRTPTDDDDADVPYWQGVLADDVAADVDKIEDTVQDLAPRVPALGTAEDLLFVLRDAAHRETWLGARSDNGGPSNWAVQLLREALGVGPMSAPGYLFALTDADRRLTDLAIRAEDGQFADFVVERLKARILSGFTAAAPAPPRTYADAPYSKGSDVFPVRANPLLVAGWGSSSMEYANGQISVLFTDKGATWHGGGKAGEFAEHTAARLGSRPALLSVPTGLIPASGPVTVTASNVPTASSLKAFTGTLAGVPGTLACDGNRFTFTRTTAGSTVTVDKDAPFITDGTFYRDAVSLLWMGKNNLTNGAAPGHVIGITDDAFNWLAPAQKRALVLGHFVNTGATASDPSRAPITTVNAAHKRRYGRLFIDVSGYITGAQVWADTGITPTAEDLAEQAAGNKPPSLSSDAGHFNYAGALAVANHLIAPRLTELGWY